MKSNAIARIILHTILALVLIGILVSALLVDGFLIRTGSDGIVIEEEALFDANTIKNIQINWAAGSVTIRAADTNQITVCEVAPDDCKYHVTYEIHGDTLELNYGNGTIIVGFGTSLPSKDLIITVPQDWICQELEIDGAALDINLQNLVIGKIELDGANCDLNFAGSLEQMDADGAATKIKLVCSNRISSIDVDGASCNLDLMLPEGCGFLLEMDGISCVLHTELCGTSTNDQTVYGDGHCKIYVDGVSCDVTIREAQ